MGCHLDGFIRNKLVVGQLMRQARNFSPLAFTAAPFIFRAPFTLMVMETHDIGVVDRPKQPSASWGRIYIRISLFPNLQNRI